MLKDNVEGRSAHCIWVCRSRSRKVIRFGVEQVVLTSLHVLVLPYGRNVPYGEREGYFKLRDVDRSYLGIIDHFVALGVGMFAYSLSYPPRINGQCNRAKAAWYMYDHRVSLLNDDSNQDEDSIGVNKTPYNR